MTLRGRIFGALATAALVGGLGTGAPALAADPPQAPGGESCLRGRDLMTADEREAHRAKVAAATPEEQAKLRAANHAELERRAAAKKLPLCGKGPAGPGGPPAAP